MLLVLLRVLRGTGVRGRGGDHTMGGGGGGRAEPEAGNIYIYIYENMQKISQTHENPTHLSTLRTPLEQWYVRNSSGRSVLLERSQTH